MIIGPNGHVERDTSRTSHCSLIDVKHLNFSSRKGQWRGLIELQFGCHVAIDFTIGM